MKETRVPSLGWEDPLEREMATHSSILAWEIPWTGKLGRLQSMGLQNNRTKQLQQASVNSEIWNKIDHSWSDLTSVQTHKRL